MGLTGKRGKFNIRMGTYNYGKGKNGQIYFNRVAQEKNAFTTG